MNPKYLVQKVDWFAVTKDVRELTGKPYPINYVREVAQGDRNNNTLKPVLEHLGVKATRAA